MRQAVELREVFCVHRTSEGDAAALQGTTLEVDRGEVICVLGPSGAGKSTLLRVIAGLQTPSAGEVRVLGEDVGRASDAARSRLRHRGIGFLGQAPGVTLSPDLEIGAAITLPLALRGVSRARQRARAGELLDATGLSDAGAAYPAVLSGGERQRAALCVALAHEPKILLADEPTGELDEQSAKAIRTLILQLSRAHGTTAIIVSHDTAVAKIADRVLRIRDGRIIEDGSALVVARGGWVRLPAELLAEAGIRDRARVRHRPGGLLVTAVDGPTARASRETPLTSRRGPRTPARIELRTVFKGYGRRLVLDGLSLSIPPGRLSVVTGPSGSGKTTLMRLVAGLELPDQGALLIDGRPVQRDDAERRAARRRERIGYLPQEPAPIGFLSAHENVVLALQLRGAAALPAAAQATQVLAHVGLMERSRQRVSRLSAGEAQRVALARALAGAGGLLIVDEPTSRLDEHAAGMVGAMLADIAALEGQTVLCASHDEQVIRHAEHIVQLGGPDA